MKLTRRNVLQLLGCAAAGYATSSFGPRSARADNTVPKRLLFFFTCQGTFKQLNLDGSVRPYWAPTTPGAPDALSLSAPWSTSQFTLGDLHTPLLSHQNDLLFLDGIDMVSAWMDMNPNVCSHAFGRGHSLIGVDRASWGQGINFAGGISVDQYIAKGINSPTPLTPLPSLQLAAMNGLQDLDDPGDTPVYAASKQPITMPGSPAAVYGRLFPNGPQNQDPAAIARLLAQQTSVLDHVQADLTKLSGRVSALDKQRLDAHASAVRDLEKRLAVAPAACVEPDASIYATASQDNTADAFNANVDVMLHLTQVALACDLTRIVTFYIDEANPDCFGYAPFGGTASFHDLVHATNGYDDGVSPLFNDPKAIGIVKAYHRYNATQFGKLLHLLAQTPEPDGTTLLDNTLLVWCGELAGGDHSLGHVPYLLAGKMGGAVTPGRYVRFPRKMSTLDPYTGCNCSYSPFWGTQGPAHNDFLAALATMMGVPTTKFGNPAVATGPLGGWAT
jgi:hypothetical protein